MCGIAGYMVTDPGRVSPEACARINDGMERAILFRGRDDSGRVTLGLPGQEPPVQFISTRLAIIDKAQGQQPMQDGDVVLSFNGEIYNYVELRKDYEALGYRFRTRSDTEVILAGYRLKGMEVCRDLNGMFAFALYDRAAGRLFLARDRLGKKPLFWTRQPGLFAFASSIDALRACPGWVGTISPATWLFMQALSGLPQQESFFRQAKALPPGHWIEFAAGMDAPVPHRFWRLEFPEKSSRPFGELLEEYEHLLRDAIRIRLRSDVPVALTFSGGVDSGSIAALCVRDLDVRPLCYTVDYDAPDDPSEEKHIAEQAAGLLGLPWRYVPYDYRKRLFEDLDAIYPLFDQPCNQMPMTYAHHLYRTIKPEATVVLSGDGGDELFTGYNGDERLRARDLAEGREGRNAGTALVDEMEAGLANWAKQQANGDPEVIDQLTAWFQDWCGQARAAGVATHLDLSMHAKLTTNGVDPIYRVPDVAGMAAQVEVRAPFLDHRLVAFAARLPHRYKVGDPGSPEKNKFLPKVHYESLVGPEIAWAAKKGMGFNLRWGDLIAADDGRAALFDRAYDQLDRHAIPSAPYREAFAAYRRDKLAKLRQPTTGGTAMVGFMLGQWLALRNIDRDAASPTPLARAGVRPEPSTPSF